MKQLTLNLGLTMVLTACSTVSAAQPRIAWYGTLESGLAAAEKTNRPILLISAAPHCVGVPGMW